MPFGVSNTQSTFQATMNNLLKPFLRKFVIVSFVDILIYNPSSHIHIEHLTTVFQCLQENQFYLKQSKCSFLQESIEYLGHIISYNGVAPNQ